jgi:hypothetical protein
VSAMRFKWGAGQSSSSIWIGFARSRPSGLRMSRGESRPAARGRSSCEMEHARAAGLKDRIYSTALPPPSLLRRCGARVSGSFSPIAVHRAYYPSACCRPNPATALMSAITAVSPCRPILGDEGSAHFSPSSGWPGHRRISPRNGHRRRRGKGARLRRMRSGAGDEAQQPTSQQTRHEAANVVGPLVTARSNAVTVLASALKSR